MSLRSRFLTGIIVLIIGTVCRGDDFHVSPSGAHIFPFADWSSAATNIQDAIDAASAGDTVWVTNGVYAVGGKAISGDLTNRVALDKALNVRSVNGPSFTIIDGSSPTNGLSAVRCAWLTNGATLNGFTLRNGATRSTSGAGDSQGWGGGIYCASTNAFVLNCQITRNMAAFHGAGVYQGYLSNCVVADNFTANTGFGGGSYNSIAENSSYLRNTSRSAGGGAYGGVLNNCWIAYNTAPSGGGASFATLNNCTVTRNVFTSGSGGGTQGGTNRNCIIFYNHHSFGTTNNYSGGTFQNCCTFPLASGTGNIASDPLLLADAQHLASTSPCRGAGTNLFTTGVDLDGNIWSNPPSMGCDEWTPEPLVIKQDISALPDGSGQISIQSVVAGQEPFAFRWLKDELPMSDDAQITGTTSSTLLINILHPNAAGDYRLLVSNSTAVVTGMVSTVRLHYANIGATNPVAPYTNWLTAATNIQDAIDAADTDAVVLVTNGTYSTGGKAISGDLTNRIALTKALLVQSINGPEVTVVQGAWHPGTTNGATAVRCAWLTNGATLSGFTLRGGATRTSGDANNDRSGGGAWCISASNSVLANCVIRSNSAHWNGGGIYQGVGNRCLVAANASLNNGGGNYAGNLTACLVISNSALFGAGSYNANLQNCTVTGNTAKFAAGGVFSGRAVNCILYYNTGDNYYSGTTNLYSCTTPMPVFGLSNITAAPGFLDNFGRLGNGSPCRNTGTNLILNFSDLAGHAWGIPPSRGCYEWQAAPLVSAPASSLIGYPPGFALTATAAGQEPLSYWWIKDGAPLTEDGHYSSLQSTNLFVSSPSLEHAGAYQLVVSNAYGMTTSAVAQVVIHCVDAGGMNPTPPYASWATAATNIQDAINVAKAGEIVLVTNGVYLFGGKAMSGGLTNRVAVDKALLLTSVNGPAVTVIDGASTTNGPAAIRCAWMTNSATLNGFTLQYGATRPATGSLNPETSGGGVWGVSTNATLVNCWIVTNRAGYSAGGAYRVTLLDCWLKGNEAIGSGSAGGGWAGAGTGGGAMESNLRNCILDGNSAVQTHGGGANSCNLQNCLLIRNSTYMSGAAAYLGTLVNCTVVSNISGGYGGYGGAVASATLTNCIVWDNVQRSAGGAPTNHTSCSFAFSDSIPLPAGDGNISVNPLLLADGLHLAENSPCRGAGTSNVIWGTDIDGQPWENPPPMGCDEWHPEPLVALQPRFVLGVARSTVVAVSQVAGADPFDFLWLKDGVPLELGSHFVTTNSTLLIKSLMAGDAGIYQLVASNSFGATTSSIAPLVIHCVDAANTTPAAPYSNWATAATTIQEAIDAAQPGAFVLVTNGNYATGGKVVTGDLMNRVVLDKPLNVLSVNGPAVTTIFGQWDPVSTNGPAAVRCAWIGDGAILDGFTLTGGATRNIIGSYYLSSGGGVWGASRDATVAHCIVKSNACHYQGAGVFSGTVRNSQILGNVCIGTDGPGASGGGTAYSLMFNSYIAGNYARSGGGGSYGSTLLNCTIINNASEWYGNAITSSKLTNCIAYYNQPLTWNNNSFDFNVSAAYSCTPTLVSGPGNIAAHPQLLDAFHLAETSPCRGVGTNLATGFDLDGEAWNNPPSIGCDEFWSTGVTGALAVAVSSLWPEVAEKGSLPLFGEITGRASRVAWDFGDGSVLTNASPLSTAHVWTNAGDYSVTFTAFNTDHPSGVSTTLPVHVVPLQAPVITVDGFSGTSISLSIEGQPGITYRLQQATNLAPPVTWQTIRTAFSPGGQLQFSDNTATNEMMFYRVEGP